MNSFNNKIIKTEEGIENFKNYYETNEIVNKRLDTSNSLLKNLEINKKINNDNQEEIKNIDKNNCYRISINNDKSSKIIQRKRILEFDNQNQSLSNIFGDFDLNDKPINILKARRFENVIEFIVEWKLRENGFKPKNSVVTNLEFKKNNSDFLINFYEQRLIFGDTLRQQRITQQKNISQDINSNKKLDKIKNEENNNILSNKSINIDNKRNESLYKI